MNCLLNIVKEKGIVKDILDLKNHMEFIENEELLKNKVKFIKVIQEIHESIHYKYIWSGFLSKKRN